MKPFCAAVDWGTSNFRLWILTTDGNPIAERQTGQGLRQAIDIGFENIIEQHISALGFDADLPVVICGMAGSRQGWCEARYVDTPADLGHVIQNAVNVPGIKRDIRILPGIAQRNSQNPDVIRGEETQLLGLIDKLPSDGIVCMPGTHSKWVRFDQGRLENFSTFMTGELFGLLANHSILKLGLDESRQVSPKSSEFLLAVSQSCQSPQEITNRLFMARSSKLLGYSSVHSSAAGLSGSVVGLELAGALSKFGSIEQVTLVATGQLRELYASALQSRRTTVHCFDADDAVKSGLFEAARAFWDLEDERKMGEA
jgi:2-dehydro-3-deoxygalactonokinase